jgi:hypothetical protein
MVSSCFFEMIGPMSGSLTPGPTRIDRARSTSRVTSSSWAARWTSSRDPAEQVCPAFWKMALATP